jgi:hypothetical protein
MPLHLGYGPGPRSPPLTATAAYRLQGEIILSMGICPAATGHCASPMTMVGLALAEPDLAS